MRKLCSYVLHKVIRNGIPFSDLCIYGFLSIHAYVPSTAYEFHSSLAL